MLDQAQIEDFKDESKEEIARETKGNSEMKTKANARLIAAAPDLLEALQELCEIVEDAIEQKSAKDLDSFTLQPARAAIARATGEQP